MLCDRFTDATYAYQGGGRGLSFERIGLLEEWVQGDLRPILTVLLDVSVAVGLERAGRRGAADRFERETVRFFERVRAVYLERAKRYPERYRLVNADRPIEMVRIEIQSILASWLERIGSSTCPLARAVVATASVTRCEPACLMRCC